MRDAVKTRIDQVVFSLYSETLKGIFPHQFPLNPKAVIQVLFPESCRVVSYQHLTDEQHTDIQTVINALGSEDGCTHYDTVNQRYLIAYNENRYKPRIRWTLAHELGHIICGHFTEIEANGEKSINALWQDMEEEADYFAASILAPFQAMYTFHAESELDVKMWFGISDTAATLRWIEYKKWIENHNSMEEINGICWSIDPLAMNKTRYKYLRANNPDLLWGDIH